MRIYLYHLPKNLPSPTWEGIEGRGGQTLYPPLPVSSPQPTGRQA